MKVLDFGLAKMAEEVALDGNPENSPTLTLELATSVGAVMGTAAYMAPEQARGKPVDKRADIWAFGVVLYEMLTGQRLFGGETISDTLASVLKEEPIGTAFPNGPCGCCGVAWNEIPGSGCATSVTHGGNWKKRLPRGPPRRCVRGLAG